MPGPPAIGPYVVERELGSGQMGVVYQVRHLELDHVYALKLLRAELCEAADVARFRREVEQLAALGGHPNVVRVHSAGEERGRLYYVMELVLGETLEALRSRGPVDAARVARWGRDVASALAALHARGGVHRDVKPSNVLVDRVDGRARLTDFGLARGVTGDRLSLTGELLGTPLYMAPEQALGLPVGPPADVYALGGTLFMLLAGRPPVDGGTVIEVLDRVSRGVRRRVVELAPDAPAGLAALVERALALAPDARPTAEELARDLDALTRGEGDARGARGLRTLALAALASLALAVGAVAWAARPRPRAPAAAELDAATRLVECERLAPLLNAPGAPSPADLAALAALLEASQRDESPLVRGGALEVTTALAWAHALDGEVALRRGDAQTAATRLAAASSAPDPRGRLRAPIGALRAKLAAARPDLPAADAIGALADAEVALERWPRRHDLRAARVRLALRAGQLELALERARAEPDLPPALRVEALLEAAAGARSERVALGLVDAAAEVRLGGSASDEELRGRLAWGRARTALGPAGREELAVACARIFEGRALERAPRAPERRALAAALRAVEPSIWPDGDATRRQAPTGEVLRLLQLHELLRLVDPDHVLPADRIHQLEVFNSGMGGGRIEDLAALGPDYRDRLERLAPARVNFAVGALEILIGHVLHGGAVPSRDRPRFQRARGLARAQDLPLVLDRIDELEARYLFIARDDVSLSALADRFERESGERVPIEVAHVRGRLAELLALQGRLAEAEREVQRTLVLDAHSLEAHGVLFALRVVQVPKAGDAAAARAAAIAAGHAWLPLALRVRRDDLALSQGASSLVDLQVQAGRPDDALRTVEHALESSPRGFPVLFMRRLLLLCARPERGPELARALRTELPRRIAERVSEDTRRLGAAAAESTWIASMRDSGGQLEALARAAEAGDLPAVEAGLQGLMLAWSWSP